MYGLLFILFFLCLPTVEWVLLDCKFNDHFVEPLEDDDYD